MIKSQVYFFTHSVVKIPSSDGLRLYSASKNLCWSTVPSMLLSTCWRRWQQWQKIWMSVDVDGGSSDRVERTEQIKSFHSTEPKDHLVSRYHDERLQSSDITHQFSYVIVAIVVILVLITHSRTHLIITRDQSNLMKGRIAPGPVHDRSIVCSLKAFRLNVFKHWTIRALLFPKKP